MTETENAQSTISGDAADDVTAPIGSAGDNVADALQFIDAELGRMLEREVIAAAEVSDLLLDLRVLLASSPEPTPAA